MASSNIIFKVNKPLSISKGTGVTLLRDGVEFTERDFDGSDVGLVRLSIGQDVATASSVQFSQITLDPTTLVINSGSANQMTFKDGEISGSKIRFLSGLNVTKSVIAKNGLNVTGLVTSGSSTYTSSSKVHIIDSGSTIWGESLSQKQFFTGSLELTGSFDINDIAGELIEISNDGNLTDASSGSLITEAAASAYLASLRPDRDYLRKSFVHTGSFVNSSTSSFAAVTASAPTNLTSTTENDFMFFVNGMLIENDALTIQQKGATDLELRLDTSSLGYTISSDDEIIGFGKFNS